jgi:Domain of unknown function (DUF4129)
VKARLPMVFAVVALGLLVAIVAWGTSGIPVTPRPADPGITPPRYTVEPVTMVDVPDVPVSSVSGLLAIIILLVVGLFVLIAIMVAGIRLRSLNLRLRRSVPAGSPGDPGWLSEVTRTAVSAMDRHVGGPPSDAVIAAWVQLEQSAAASGTERAAHQTPSEFTEAVLAEHSADAAALHELKAVYQRARFGEPGQVTTADAEAARAALRRIALAAT